PEGAAEAGRVQVWDLKTGTLERSFPAPGIWRQEGVVVSPDGRCLAHFGHLDGQAGIRLHDFRTGKWVRTICEPSAYFPVGFSADGKELSTSPFPANGGKRVLVWSTADGSKLREVALTKFDRVTLSPDGKTALVNPSRYGDNQELWDLATGKKLADLGRQSAYGKPTFLNGGKELALLFDYYSVPEFRVWEVGAEKDPVKVRVPAKHKDPIRYALSDDRSAVAVLEYYGNLRVYDAGKAEPRFTFPAKASLC